ncbi:MAG: lysine--tRNA ligase, partial [Patescibacteria group bacterium]
MIEDLRNERLKKLEKLVSLGYEVFPASTKRTATVAEVLKGFQKLARGRKKVSVVGRIMGMRNQGSLIFLDLRDATETIQIVAKKNEIRDFSVFQNNLDIGDFLEATGQPFVTKRGEKSIEAKSLNILSKSLRPLPSQWHGLEDTEIRFRKRYLDLLMRPELRSLFEAKMRFWATTRAHLVEHGFIEVETPVLESVPGGAEAEPFVTHHNALDQDFYLRISLELPLKRLMVGGFEKVFEIGRIFRNEGIDAEHLQDYTQMELYWAYQDYAGLMAFIEKLVKRVVKSTTGSFTTISQGKKINWGRKWPRLEYYDLFKKGTGINLHTASEKDLREKAEKLGLSALLHRASKGRIVDLLFKHTVRQELTQPAFLVNPPVEIEPLAKRMRKDQGRVERFQVVGCGTELGKGFSELNDPLDQRKRFEEQMKLRAAGDKEAQMLDEDFLEALEYGMPPASGFGVS